MIGKKEGIYSLSLYFTQGVALLSGFFIAKILKPANYGYYATGKMVISYAMLFSLGLPNAMIKIIPSIKNTQEERSIFYTAMSFSFIHSFFAFLFAMALLYIKDIQITYRTFILIGTIVLFSILRDIVIFYLRGKLEFFKLSILQIVASILMIVYLVFLYFIGEFRAWKVLFGVAIYSVPFVLSYAPIKIVFDFSIYKRLIKNGFPLLISGLISSLIFQMDRWFIIFTKDIKEVGFYSFAASIAGIFYIFPAALSHIAYPQMIGSEENEEFLFARKHIKTLLLFTPLLVIIIRNIANLGITYVLYEYYYALKPMDILIIAMIFAGILNILYGIWISNSQWIKLIFYQFIPLLINFILNYYFLVILDKSIVFAAYASLISMFVYMLTVVVILNFRLPMVRFVMAILISILSFLNMPLSFLIWILFAYGCYHSYI